MVRGLDARVRRLEPQPPKPQRPSPVCVWQRPGQTADEALTEAFGHGAIPRNVVLIGWTTPDRISLDGAEGWLHQTLAEVAAQGRPRPGRTPALAVEVARFSEEIPDA